MEEEQVQPGYPLQENRDEATPDRKIRIDTDEYNECMDELQHGAVDDSEEKLGLAPGNSQVTGLRKRRLLKKAPDAPKRFKSAYICFVTEKMEDVKKDLPPDKKVTDIMKVLAYMWRNLPPLERHKYESIADADKTRYFEELSHYNGPMQVPNTRQKKPADAPKRAMSAFLSFSQAMRPLIRAQHPTLKNTDISGVLAEKWRSATDEEKKPHLERELREREQYHEEMRRWRQEREEERRERVRSTIDFLDLPGSELWGESWGEGADGESEGREDGGKGMAEMELEESEVEGRGERGGEEKRAKVQNGGEEREAVEDREEEGDRRDGEKREEREGGYYDDAPFRMRGEGSGLREGEREANDFWNRGSLMDGGAAAEGVKKKGGSGKVKANTSRMKDNLPLPRDVPKGGVVYPSPHPFAPYAAAPASDRGGMFANYPYSMGGGWQGDPGHGAGDGGTAPPAPPMGEGVYYPPPCSAPHVSSYPQIFVPPYFASGAMAPPRPPSLYTGGRGGHSARDLTHTLWAAHCMYDPLSQTPSQPPALPPLSAEERVEASLHLSTQK